MAKLDIIYKQCDTCGGDGIITETSPTEPHNMVDISCHSCDGEGGTIWGWTEKVD